MYTIKKFNHGERIKSIEVGYRTFGVKSKGITWVVMLNNEPVFGTNLLTGKNELVGYSQKYTAQNEADYFNRKGNAEGYIGTNSKWRSKNGKRGF